MLELQAFLSPPVRRTTSRPSAGGLTRFTDIAGALERASGVIARLDALLTRHPLEPAWLWRIRLEAVRRQAAITGGSSTRGTWPPSSKVCGFAWIEPRRSSTGVPSSEPPAMRSGCGAGLPGPMRPKPRRSDAPLPRCRRLGRVRLCSTPRLGVRACLDRDGERPPLRAALALYWQRCGLLHLVCPAAHQCKDAGQ